MESHLLDTHICGQFCEYGQVKYPKFIPIEEGKKGYKFPSCRVDKEAPRCYFDLQTWYTDYLDEKEFRSQENFDIRFTNSAMDLTETRNRRCKHRCEMKEDMFHWTSRKSIITNKRFGTNNIKYLQNGVTEYEGVSVELYIKLVLGKRFKLHLCHLKTEMIVKCLQSFFEPYEDITVLWVNDLDFHVQKAENNKTKDIFHNSVTDRLANIKAVLYLNKGAARLLRHKEICFLDTLSVVTEIGRNEFLLLPMSTAESTD